MEMIQGEGGVIPLDKDFVVGAAKLCAENDVLFLDDEVQAGVGRSGKFLCHEHYGIEPDVVSLAKGLGGGLPIGAVLLGEKCEQVFAPGDHCLLYTSTYHKKIMWYLLGKKNNIGIYYYLITSGIELVKT